MIYPGTGSTATNHSSPLKKGQEKNFAFFNKYQMGPIEVKYSFTTDLFESLYLHALFQ